MASGGVIEVVQGDQLPQVSFRITDEVDGSVTDLSDGNVRADFEAVLSYSGVERLQRIPMAKVGTGVEGLLRLAFTNNELVGVDANEYQAAVRVYFGTQRLTFLGFVLRVEEDLAGA